MRIIDKPCAYCGTTDALRTKGHVIPTSLYPAKSLLPIQQITVPECVRCKGTWEEAEPQFKHILLSIRNPEAIEWDEHTYSMIRAFRKVDGKRRYDDLISCIVRTGEGPHSREVIYPARNPAFNLILRRIVRGLSYKHLRNNIPDDHVFADVMVWQIPPVVENEMSWNELGDGFFRYGYQQVDEPPLESFWLLTFFRHIEFFGVVFNTAEAAARRLAARSSA